MVLSKKNPNDLEASAIAGRTRAELEQDWPELISIATSFVSNNKNTLSAEQKANLNEKLLANFDQDINKFNVEIKENGLAAAFKLPFFEGQWLPVLMYEYLNT